MIFYVFTQKLKENVGGLFGAGGGAKGMLAPLKLLGGGGGGGAGLRLFLRLCYIIDI